MAAQTCLCLVVLTLAWTVSAMPNNLADEQLTDDYLTEYLAEQDLPTLKGPVEVTNWPQQKVEFGQVSGVDVAPNGDVIVFHRADKPWTRTTFNELNVMPESERKVVTHDPIVRLSGDKGEIVESLGANMFYVPHGLTVDKNGNLWLTDVGTHQVLRIPNGKKEADLILGEKFVPGSDDTHFCQPTDVAVAQNGEFFVSDGYCNSRILKFSKDGKLSGKWGATDPEKGAWSDSPYSLNVPHSLALVEDLDLICVADRENQRVLCYNAGLRDSQKLGEFNRTLVPGEEIGRIFALAYDPKNQLMHVAAVLSEEPVFDDTYSYTPARAFSYDMEGNYQGGWGYIPKVEAEQGPSIPHDIAVSPDGNDVYLADLLQHAVRKFQYPSAEQKRA